MSVDPSWDVRIVRPRALSDEEIALWTSFCASDPTLSHPFFSFAFARAVDRVHSRAFVAIIQRRGQTVGFFPFQFEGRVAAALRAALRVGGEISDRCGIIAGEPLGLSPAELLRLVGLGSFTFTFLPAEQSRHGLVGQRMETGQRVILPSEERAFWTTLKKTSREFVSQVERKGRRLTEQLGPLKVTFEANAGVELSRLVAVKVAQYQRTGGGNPLRFSWTRDLFRELLQNPDPHCTAVLSTLYAGDHWLASHLGLMSRTVFHYWFPVYNLEHARLSPGNILTRGLMEAAISRGARLFDLGGFGQYKSHFHPESYEYYAGFWRAAGLGGLANQAARSLSWRIAAIRNHHGKQAAETAATEASPASAR